MKNSNISWTNHTFNPWIGCSKVSAGCANCYAEREAFARVQRSKGVELWGPGSKRIRPSANYWKQPLKWNAAAKQSVAVRFGEPKPRVFCGSMCDWLDESVVYPWITDLLRLISDTPSLNWLLLTKRPENFHRRLAEVVADLSQCEWECDAALKWSCGSFPSNVAVGVSVENQDAADKRIPELLRIPARWRFLSCEPLLGSVDLSAWIEPFVRCGSCGECYDLDEVVPDPDGHKHGADQCAKCGASNCMCSYEGTAARSRWENGDVTESDIECTNPSINWVICGGESGPMARPMHPDWARSLRDQCDTASVPFFFKQWGDNPPRAAFYPNCREICARLTERKGGDMLDGKQYYNFPEGL